MAVLTTPSGAFPTALIYITVGVLIDIWSVLALIYYPPETNWGHYLLMGFIATGLALFIIGILLGPIGRFARHAELPPAEVTAAAANIEKQAAEHPAPVVPGVAPVQAAMASAAPLNAPATQPPANAVRAPASPVPRR
jgi:hypothetical protein